MKHPKRPKDPNARAVFIAKIATGETKEPDPAEGKNFHAFSLGQLGGKARAAKLSAKKRKIIAKLAAKKRWKKK
jgi:hypothetical protein